MAFSQVAGCILAGGLSRRMGGVEKAFISLAGKPLLAHVLERLQSQVGDIVVNANGDAARFSQFDHEVIADRIEGFSGPLAGIEAGLRWSSVHRLSFKSMVSVACDTPFFPKNLVARLCENQPDDNTIVLARSRGSLHPVFGLWPVHLGKALHDWLSQGNSRKVMDFVSGYPVREVDFSPLEEEMQEIDVFFNINQMSDLSRAETLMREGLPHE